MDWQQLASLLIVGATVLAFLFGKRRLTPSPNGCGGACGCSSKGPTTAPRMIFRARKGERPEVTVKLG